MAAADAAGEEAEQAGPGHRETAAPVAPLAAGDVPDARPLPVERPATHVRPPVRVVDLDWRSVAVVLGAFVGLAALTGLVRGAPRSLTILVVGTLLALALNPLVGAVQRRLRIRRGAAVGFVLAALAVAMVLILALLAPPAVRQAAALPEQVPTVVEELGDLPVVGGRLEDAGVPARVQRWLEELPDRLSGDTAVLERAGRAVVDGVLVALGVALVAITLLLDGQRLVGAACRLLPPARRARAERIGDLAYRVVGRYAAGSLLVAAVAGISVLVVGLALRVPLAPLVALWVAVFDLVPQIGGAAGGIPFVLLGLTRSPATGAACAVFFVLYLQFENHILSPLIVGQAVRLSPPATMTAALIGVSAAGVVGALVAVPLLGAAKVVYLELRQPGTRV